MVKITVECPNCGFYNLEFESPGMTLYGDFECGCGFNFHISMNCKPYEKKKEAK